jgi:hypothetical protein
MLPWGAASCLYCHKLLMVVPARDDPGRYRLVDPGRRARPGPVWAELFAASGDPACRRVGSDHQCDRRRRIIAKVGREP